MKLILFYILSIFFLISCGNGTETSTVAQKSTQDTLLYGKQKPVVPELAPGLQNVIENWSVFPEFKMEASQLYLLKLEALKNRAAKLIVLTDSLSKSIPDTLYTAPIQSRLIIVNTRAQLLNQEARKNNTNREAIENQISEIQSAIRNFIVQLNEKVQKDAIDMQRIDNEKKELEKQRKFLDSVYQAELEDQNN